MGGLTMAATEAASRTERSDRGPLWDAWENLEVPPGFRAEIIRGDIVLSPSPTNKHSLICAQLVRALAPLAAERDWAVANELAVYISHTAECLIPDLMVLPMAILEEADEESSVESEEPLLVAEVTSDSSVKRDRKTKLWSYAYGRVPIYLLIDRHDDGGTVTVFAEPTGNGRYSERHTAAFGKPVLLPEPFGIEIDTKGFVARKR
jgi:Uma2 family endonuclease